MKNQLLPDIITKTVELAANTLKWPRTVIFVLLTLLISNKIAAQAPKQFNFQGIARDMNGVIVPNKNVRLHFKILRDGPNGSIVFEEYNDVSTDANGAFTAMLGSQGGDFGNSNLGKGIFFLNAGIDLTGGNNFTDLGTSQLLSVPFALVANKLPDLNPIVQIGEWGAGETIKYFSPAPSLIWYPRKSAFKVGTGMINEASIGDHSVALGGNSIATSTGSMAIGTGTVANVPDGVVLGRYNDIPTIDTAGNQEKRVFQIGNGSSNQFRANALTILNTGYVGIGSNVLSPKHLLDVGGRMRIRNHGTTAGIHFNNSQNVEAGFVGMKTDSEVGFFIGGNWRFWVNGQGNGFLNGNMVLTSDRRLKRDLSPLSNSLDKLSSLTGRHYFWKDLAKSQELQTGLIAQEVEQYFPELVTTDEKGFKAVNYIGLIPHLIESMKDLKALRDEMATLKKTMQGLNLSGQETRLRKAGK